MICRKGYFNFFTLMTFYLKSFLFRQEECTFIKTDTYEYGKWDTDNCSRNKSFICEMDKKVKISDYCEDREDKGEKGYCAVRCLNLTLQRNKKNTKI